MNFFSRSVTANYKKMLVVFDLMFDVCRVASHSFTGGFAGIGKLPALFGWYIRYGIGIKVGLTNAETT